MSIAWGKKYAVFAGWCGTCYINETKWYSELQDMTQCPCKIMPMLVTLLPKTNYQHHWWLGQLSCIEMYKP